MITEEAVDFPSGTARCAGRLFKGHVVEPRPCVILCPGFGGTQDTPSMRATATAFAEHGISALTFDYHNFGSSDGTPHQLVDIDGQLDDIHAAVRFARSRPDLDPTRIALWGTSLGGGHVITAAAADPGIATAVAQIPFNGFPKHVEGHSAAATFKLLAAMVRDRIRDWLSRPPQYIPAVGAQGELAVMASDDAQQAIAGMASPTWQNRVAPRAIFDMMRYRPGRYAPRMTMPVLVCVGTGDQETPEASGAHIAEQAPHGVLRRYAYRHFDFYNPELRQRVLAGQLAFLDEVLGRPTQQRLKGDS